MKKKIVLIFVFLILIPLGAYSQSKYCLKCNPLLLQKASEIMASQIGIVERSNRNDGETEKYNIALGLPVNSPYCAAGIYWSFLQSAKYLSLNTKDIPFPKTGLANGIFNFAKSKGKRTAYKANIGDLIVWRKSATPFGHIESIFSVGKGGNVKTIAFNSSKIISGKKVEGVFLQSRNILHPLGRLRIRGIVGFNG